MKKPCFPPLLAPGFHDFDNNQIKVHCVDAFPQSARRGILYCNYIQILEQFKFVNQQHHCFSELWIDGSFTTEKPEPDDIDILVVVDFPALSALPEAMNGLVGPLLNREYVKLNFSIDVL